MDTFFLVRRLPSRLRALPRVFLLRRGRLEPPELRSFPFASVTRWSKFSRSIVFVWRLERFIRWLIHIRFFALIHYVCDIWHCQPFFLMRFRISVVLLQGSVLFIVVLELIAAAGVGLLSMHIFISHCCFYIFLYIFCQYIFWSKTVILNDYIFQLNFHLNFIFFVLYICFNLKYIFFQK